jgi:hypothetical protein
MPGEGKVEVLSITLFDDLVLVPSSMGIEEEVAAIEILLSISRLS